MIKKYVSKKNNDHHLLQQCEGMSKVYSTCSLLFSLSRASLFLSSKASICLVLWRSSRMASMSSISSTTSSSIGACSAFCICSSMVSCLRNFLKPWSTGLDLSLVATFFSLTPSWICLSNLLCGLDFSESNTKCSLPTKKIICIFYGLAHIKMIEDIQTLGSYQLGHLQL